MFRHLARPLLAAVFVSEGVSALRDPEPRAKRAAPLVTAAAERFGTPDDPMLVVRAGAGVTIAGGLGLVTGKAPRLSALALAATLVPTTVAQHSFWQAPEGSRSTEMVQFLKNAGLLGGLLLVAEPPSLRVSAHTNGRKARKAVDRKTRRAARAASKLQAKAEAQAIRTEAKLAAKVERTTAKLAARSDRAEAAIRTKAQRAAA